MSTHEFIVTVDVDDWEAANVHATEWPDRTPEGYAMAALNVASLSDARRLDGYADLQFGSALITGVMPV